MKRIGLLPPLLMVGLVVLGVYLALQFGVPDWVAFLVVGGGLAVFFLVSRMMDDSLEANEPAPMQNCLPASSPEQRRWRESRSIGGLLKLFGEYLGWR